LNQRVKYWVELSDYDLVTAEAMLPGGRYLYVGFMFVYPTHKEQLLCSLTKKDVKIFY